MYYTVMLRFHIELCITGDTCMKFLNDGRFDMINLRKMFSRHVISLKIIMKFTNESISLICGPVFPRPC